MGSKKELTFSQKFFGWGVTALLLVVTVAVLYGCVRLLGWKSFLGYTVLAMISIAVVAQIQLRKANALARRYAKLGCPPDATNVTVYFRAKFFKMAVLGWLMGGRAEFQSMFNLENVGDILKARIDRYVYLNPGAIRGPAWGKLIEVGDNDHGKFGAPLALQSYLGSDIGVAQTATFSGPVAVIVSFDTDLPMKKWATT